jgi:hypothetical protein
MIRHTIEMEAVDPHGDGHGPFSGDERGTVLRLGNAFLRPRVMSPGSSENEDHLRARLVTDQR